MPPNNGKPYYVHAGRHISQFKRPWSAYRDREPDGTMPDDVGGAEVIARAEAEAKEAARLEAEEMAAREAAERERLLIAATPGAGEYRGIFK